jgi:hypothetical protein
MQCALHKIGHSCLLGSSIVTIEKQSQWRTLSSRDYGCSTSRGIPCRLGNLKGEYTAYKNVNTIFTKLIYQQSCLCNVLYIKMLYRRTSTHSYHQPNKNSPIIPSYFFPTLTFKLSSPVSQVRPTVQIS